MKINTFGIETIIINGNPSWAINITINSSPIILVQVLNDEFWRLKHTISMKNSVSKINFNYFTDDLDKAKKAIDSLQKILFAHKVQKLVNENHFVQNKEIIIFNTLASIIDVNGGRL
jgi:hypothetical protein